MNLKGDRFRSGAMVAVSAIALAGCLSSGSSSDRSSPDDAVSALLTSIAEGDNADTVFTIDTDDTIDLRFSTDQDCDWDNVSLCDDGFIVSDVESGERILSAADELTFDTEWFVKAGNGTPAAQLESFTTPPDPDVIVFAGEPVLFFGTDGRGSDLIRTSLDQTNEEATSFTELDVGPGRPVGVATDSEQGWVYFSYVNTGDVLVIDRVREDGSDQTRVTELTDRLPDYLAMDAENQRLYGTLFDSIFELDISADGTGELTTLVSSSGKVYSGIAWNPVNEEILVISSDRDEGCSLESVTREGQSTTLVSAAANSESGPVAIDIEEQVVFAELCERNSLIQFDLTEASSSSLYLESYSGRGMAVDPINRDLIYRGNPNTVRRQSLDDPDDNEEVLLEDQPAFGRSAAILLVPEEE